MLKGWMVLGVILGLAGCATSPVGRDAAKPAPASRLYAYQGAPSATDGTLTVIRDSGFLGKGCGILVYVDGKEAALLAAGEKVSFNVPQGDHLLAAGPSGHGLCGVGGGKDGEARVIKLTATPAHEELFRIAMTQDAISIMQTSL